jgi:hypothetical protein
MKFLLVLILFLCACSSAPEVPMTVSRVEEVRVERTVDEIMERMDWPEFALVKMSRNKTFNHPDFKKYTKELIKQNTRLVEIQHWDKAFNRLSKRLESDLLELEKAVDSTNVESIAAKWQQVKVTCKKCHDIYD